MCGGADSGHPTLISISLDGSKGAFSGHCHSCGGLGDFMGNRWLCFHLVGLPGITKAFHAKTANRTNGLIQDFSLICLCNINQVYNKKLSPPIILCLVSLVIVYNLSYIILLNTNCLKSCLDKQYMKSKASHALPNLCRHKNIQLQFILDNPKVRVRC